MRKKILVVDDDQRILNLYMRLFEAVGLSMFDIVTMPDPYLATEYVLREKVDVVILDLRMPKVNGQKFYEALKEYNPELKVIVSSVYPIDKQRKMVPDATGYYDKSCGPIQLVEKVANVLVNCN
ncbi:MAG: response regulator [Candidatus Omnitrophica bacterium]|nr:response regulator [Candidatus Omnitrophota bacterium]